MKISQILHDQVQLAKRLKVQKKAGVTVEEITGCRRAFEHLRQEYAALGIKHARVEGYFKSLEKRLILSERLASRIAGQLLPIYNQLLRAHASLLQLKESAEACTIYDVVPLQLKLIEIEENYIDNGNFLVDKDSIEMSVNPLLPGQAILRVLLEKCYRQANILLYNTDSDKVSPCLLMTFNQLHRIRRKLERMKWRKVFYEGDLKALRKELLEISTTRESNCFIDPHVKDSTVIPEGQAILTALLEQNFEIVQDLQNSQETIDDKLKPIYNGLASIKHDLDAINVNRRFDVDPMVILRYYQKLVEIDSFRRNGKFYGKVDGEVQITDPEPDGQVVLHYLLHKCYREIYQLLSMSEPVDESLQGLQRQLLALRRCLQELKTSHQETGEDIYERHCLSPATNRCDPILRTDDIIPVQLKLTAIDRLRVNGKFVNKAGEAPKGQTALNSLLKECYDFVYELRDIAQRNERIEAHLVELDKLAVEDERTMQEEEEHEVRFETFMEPASHFPVIPIVPI